LQGTPYSNVKEERLPPVYKCGGDWRLIASLPEAL